MQDQQNNLYTSSFKEKQRYILTYSFLFFIPVAVICVLIELLVLNIPENYINNSNYYKKNKDKIEVMAFGSSQMAGAINPEFIDKPSICLASASQHHKLDFTILKQLQPRIKNLKYVVLELSTSHLELPHNSKDFWKNSIYLKYFKVNAFERKTYFKDELIFLSNTDIYSKKLIDYYVKNKNDFQLNKYGFETNNFNGIFNKLDYNEEEINKIKTFPNQFENPKTFKHNTEFLYSILDYLKGENIQPILCTLPLYKTYRASLNSQIIKRRDSIIVVIKRKYPEVVFIESERDSIFNIRDFNNFNHLNPRGAEKFTKKLNETLNNL